MTSEITEIDERGKVNWLTTTVFTLFHVGAIGALFCFSWQRLIAAAVLYWITIGMGIGMGYHRLLTHRSYKVPLWFEYFLAVCGALTLEGGPIFWVGTHRIHHQNSDREGDPHSPMDGAWWAHVLWMVYGTTASFDTKGMGRYAPELYKRPFYRWLNTYHYIPLIALGVTIWAVFGWQMMLWTIFLRVTLGLHATWAVNSATHMWGERRFQTRDDSRNNWWVALLTFGEGWHNNHHAHPNSARHGLAWYEFDMTWIQIWFLSKLGFAQGVKTVKIPQPESQQKAA